MGCGHSSVVAPDTRVPERVDVPLDGVPAYHCATLKPRPKGGYLIRYDGSNDFTEAQLPEPPKRPLEPGETAPRRDVRRPTPDARRDEQEHEAGAQQAAEAGGAEQLAVRE